MKAIFCVSVHMICDISNSMYLVDSVSTLFYCHKTLFQVVSTKPGFWLPIHSKDELSDGTLLRVFLRFDSLAVTHFNNYLCGYNLGYFHFAVLG